LTLLVCLNPTHVTDIEQNVTILQAEKMGEKEVKRLEECYTSYHPDSKWWLPDSKNGAHFSVWARFDPQDIYYVGGFGE